MFHPKSKDLGFHTATFGKNITQVYAYSRHYRYPCYYFAYAQLSDRLGHVKALLGYNGYRRIHGQAIFDWENFNVTPTPPKIPITFSIEWTEGRGERANCTVKAHKAEEKVGECHSISAGVFSRHPDAQDWTYTEWLGIEDDFQGKGFGKFLLQYSLQEMQKAGYRHASISTNLENYRAILFYSNLGYKVVDWTYEYQKAIK